MADWREQLAELEAGLAAGGQLVCPVCRLAQAADSTTCARCGADVSLLSGLLGEAAERKQALYRAVLAGETVDALAALDEIAQLTGPSLELAVLRRLLRCGTVPVEVLGDLSPAGPPTADEPLAVYDLPEPAASPLVPPPDADLAAERAAYASLWHEPEDPQPDEPPLGTAASSPPEDAPESVPDDAAPSRSPALSHAAESAPRDRAVPPVPVAVPAHRGEWVWAVVALLATFLVGAAVGRLSLAHWPPAAAGVQSIPWKMAPQPDAKP